MVGFFLTVIAFSAGAASPPVVASITPQPTLPAVSSIPASDSGLRVSALHPPVCASEVRLAKKSRTFQRNLESALTNANLTKYTKRGRLSVAVVDLSRADETYYAGVNDDDMMYAASLPKIAILLAVADAAQRGEINWTPEFDVRLTAMITESNNGDATWGAEQVGLESIQRSMLDPRYCFYDAVHGGLWVGRYYGPGPENREPLKDLSHAATARQAARFYTMLTRGELVSKEWSDHLLRLMGPPKHHHKFVGGLEGRNDVAVLARKSGTWRNWHSDSVLIQHGDQRYVAVGLSELKNGEEVMRALIRVIDDLVMDGKYRKPRRNNT